MEFLKKNWAKLAVATVTGVGAILYFILLVTAPAGASLANIASLLGPFFFFTGMTMYIIMSLFGNSMVKKIAALTLALFGLLATIFMIILLVEACDVSAGATGFDKNINVFPVVGMLFVFGLIPLIRGVQKVCKSCCGKNQPQA